MKSSHNKLIAPCIALSIVLTLSACAPTPQRPYGYEARPEPAINPVSPANIPQDYAIADTYQAPPPVYRPPVRTPVYRPPVPTPTPVTTRSTPLPEQGRVIVEKYSPPRVQATTRPLPEQGRVNVERLDKSSMGQVKIERYRPSPVATSPVEQNTRVAGRNEVSRVTTNALPTPTPVPVKATPSPITASVTKPVAPTRNYAYSPAIQSIVNSANIEAKQGKWGRASDFLERALRINADNPLLWLQMAQVKQKLGDKGQAISMAQRAKQVADNDPYMQQRAQSFINNLR